MRRINTLFGRNTDTLAMTPSAADYHQAAQHLTNLQLDYFSAIKKTYYYFEPVYLKAAGFFESPDGWQKLSGAIDAALGKTLTGNSVSSLTPQLCNTLYQTYLRTGDSLIAGQNYNEALLILRNAEVLCANLRGTDCSLALYNRLSQATYGIYDAYLRVARSAMEARNLDMAGRYLLRAMDFQLQNSSLIITAGDADKLFEDLAWQYFEQGRELSRNEDRDQALAAFISARDIYTRLGISTFDEALKYEIEKLQRQ